MLGDWGVLLDWGILLSLIHPSMSRVQEHEFRFAQNRWESSLKPTALTDITDFTENRKRLAIKTSMLLAYLALASAVAATATLSVPPSLGEGGVPSFFESNDVGVSQCTMQVWVESGLYTWL